MSLINDALKQARKAPPRNTPASLPPLQPAAAADSSLIPAWLLPVIVILLIVAAIFFIGWAVAHHSVRTIADAPDATPGAQPATVSVPVVKAPPADPPAAAINPPDAPRLQGIFYSPTAPSAIVDGKTIHPGDQFREYKVKAISKYTVTLVGPDKKEIRLGMDN